MLLHASFLLVAIYHSFFKKAKSSNPLISTGLQNLEQLSPSKKPKIIINDEFYMID